MIRLSTNPTVSSSSRTVAALRCRRRALLPRSRSSSPHAAAVVVRLVYGMQRRVCCSKLAVLAYSISHVIGFLVLVCWLPRRLLRQEALLGVSLQVIPPVSAGACMLLVFLIDVCCVVGFLWPTAEPSALLIYELSVCGTLVL